MKYFKILAVDTGASTYILSIAKLLPTDVVGFNIAIAIWWIRAAVDLADWRSVVLRFQSKMEGLLHIMSQFAIVLFFANQYISCSQWDTMHAHL